MKKLFIVLGLILSLSINATSATNAAFAYSTESAMYYNEGLDFYQNGEYSRAIEAFRTAVAKEPGFVDAYYNLGAIYEYLKSYQSAISCFSKINQLQPKDTETVLKLAELYNKVGNSDKALFFIDKIPEDDQFYSKAKALKQQYTMANQRERAKQTLSNVNKANELNKSVINKFSGPTGVAIDSQGVLFVASYTDNSIYRVMPNGQSYLFSKSPLLGGPIGLAFDSNDNLYVANYDKNNILKINKGGQIFVFMDKITNPYYLLIKGSNLYLSEQGNNTVIRYKLY